MAEWTKAAVLKTAVGLAHRGFESHSLRLHAAPRDCGNGPAALAVEARAPRFARGACKRCRNTPA